MTKNTRCPSSPNGSPMVREPLNPVATVLAAVLITSVTIAPSRPATAQQVALPLDRYESMREAAKVPEHEAPSPAAAIAFERASIEIAVHSDRAEVIQTLTLAVYADGWQTLPLTAIGSLVEADLGGLEGRLDAKDGWTLHVLGRGRHLVRLTSAVPVTPDPKAAYASWHLNLALPSAAMVHGTLVVPPLIDRVEAANTVIIAAPDAEGRRRFVADGGVDLDLTLTGGSDAPTREALPLRFVARSGVSVNAGRTRRHAKVHVIADVRQGQLERLILPFSTDYEILSVESDHRVGWRLDDPAPEDQAAGDRATNDSHTPSHPIRRLVVTPAKPVRGTLGIRILMAAPPTAQFTAPLIAPAGADWIRYVVRVGANDDGILDVADRGDARPPEGDEQPTLVAPLTEAPGRPWIVPEAGRSPTWQLRWADDTTVLAAQVDRLLVEVLLGEDGRTLYRTWVETRNAGATELAVRLPDGATLIDAKRDGLAAIPGRRGGELVLPLAAHERTQILQLDALTTLAVPDDGRFDLPLPGLSAPASRVEVRVLVSSSRGVTLVNPLLASAVSAPATPHARTISTSLARQLNAAVDLSTEALENGFLAPPLGWTALEATWNALVSNPQPLALEVRRLPARREWF